MDEAEILEGTPAFNQQHNDAIAAQAAADEVKNTALRTLQVMARNYSREMPEALITMLEDIHRNACAFGWEIGNGAEWSNTPLRISPDNPFADLNWAKHVVQAGEQDD